MTATLPDRLSVNPQSPHYSEEVLKQDVGVRFNGVEKTIPVTPGMREWAVTVPAMPASAAPKTLRVSFSIDGELAHERVSTNIVIGDVWYVAAPAALPKLDAGEKSSAPVRMMTRKAKGSTACRPVCRWVKCRW